VKGVFELIDETADHCAMRLSPLTFSSDEHYCTIVCGSTNEEQLARWVVSLQLVEFLLNWGN